MRLALLYEFQVYDLHCHFLPGVDDGAPDLDSALDLARASVANGIRGAVLTPHLYPGRWNNILSEIRPRFDAFAAALRENAIDLQVKLGAEVHLLPESLALIDQGELPTIGQWNDKQVVLLEMPDGQIPVGAANAVKYFVRRGIVPMIAHPERNKDVVRNIQKLTPLIAEGCLVQLTAASVCGRFGNSALETSMRLLDANMVTVIATDAHNITHRPPILAEARQALTARYGEKAAVLLTGVNPAAIFGSQ